MSLHGQMNACNCIDAIVCILSQAIFASSYALKHPEHVNVIVNLIADSVAIALYTNIDFF